MDFLFREGVLVIPRARAGLPAISIELERIKEIESRIPELVRATPTSAIELMTTFNEGMLHYARAISLIELEKKEAQQAMKEAEAFSLLEKAEELLKTKGQKSTAETRNAAVDLDQDVRDARSRFNTLSTYSTYFSHRMQAVEMAYYGAKKVLDVNLKLPDEKVLTGGK